MIAPLRSRAQACLWRLLGRDVTNGQLARLDALLKVPQGSRFSPLDRLRAGPVSVSSPSLVAALQRLQAVRELGIALPAARVPPSRLASLARFAGAAKVSAMGRLPPARRIATLVAFVHCLEATAQDDALEVLERLLRALFAEAAKADRQARLRTLKDLDQAAILLAAACRLLLDPVVVDVELRPQVFARVPQNTLTQALDNVDALTRPPDDVFYGELEKRYGKVRRFLPTLLKQVHFGASPAGKPVVAAFDWLRENDRKPKPDQAAPREVVRKPWQRSVLRDDGKVDRRAYTFSGLSLKQAGKREYSLSN